MTDTLITIDQRQITAPNFPRSDQWWRRFLPIWFTHRQWWTQDYATLSNNSITVDPNTSLVVINISERDHAKLIFQYLINDRVLGKYMPSSAVTWNADRSTVGSQT